MNMASSKTTSAATFGIHCTGLAPHILQLFKEGFDGHAIGQGNTAAGLYNGPIGQRIAIGHAQFDEVGAIVL